MAYVACLITINCVCVISAFSGVCVCVCVCVCVSSVQWMMGTVVQGEVQQLV